MERFLILKLEGVLQSWGAHTFEDYRPSHGFPTLSGLLGLLGACLGIERDDMVGQQALAQSVAFAVRADQRRIGAAREPNIALTVSPSRLTDFHTVLDARKVGGKTNEYPVVSRREYLCDASFTVVIRQKTEAVYTLDHIEQAVRHPKYTPSLGRRSCPLTRPLFECFVDSPSGPLGALHKVAPRGGVIYAELDDQNLQQLRIRDRPIHDRSRQFASRRISIHVDSGGTT